MMVKGRKKNDKDMKNCKVQLKRLKVAKGKKAFKVIPVDIPRTYLPFKMDIIDLFDSPIPVEKAKSSRVYKPKLIMPNISKTNYHGWYQGQWLASTRQQYENISMIVEDPNSGDTNRSWCGVSPTKSP